MMAIMEMKTGKIMKNKAVVKKINVALPLELSEPPLKRKVSGLQLLSCKLLFICICLFISDSGENNV